MKKLLNKDEEKKEAKLQAEKEKEEIQNVKRELLEMFVNPERKKRYFSVVDMEDIVENEFSLNIPRYVDTFEPDEEIDLITAISEFKKEFEVERKQDEKMIKVLEDLKL